MVYYSREEALGVRKKIRSKKIRKKINSNLQNNNSASTLTHYSNYLHIAQELSKVLRKAFESIFDGSAELRNHKPIQLPG